MGKCGHDICPDDNCALNYPFNGGRRARCRRIQGCIETSCNTLKTMGASGFVLYDACIGHCHKFEGDPTYPQNYPRVEDYLCENFDPITLVEYFGVNPCAVSEEETRIGQVKAEEAKTNATTIISLLVIASVIGGLLWMLMGKNKSK